jgi:hypothetical protein
MGRDISVNMAMPRDAAPPHARDRTCRDFSKGTCHRGASCRFEHPGRYATFALCMHDILIGVAAQARAATTAAAVALAVTLGIETPMHAQTMVATTVVIMTAVWAVMRMGVTDTTEMAMHPAQTRAATIVETIGGSTAIHMRALTPTASPMRTATPTTAVEVRPRPRPRATHTGPTPTAESRPVMRTDKGLTVCMMCRWLSACRTASYGGSSSSGSYNRDRSPRRDRF